MLVSPGALDMGGLLITPREEDFRKMTLKTAVNILREVTLTESETLQAVRRIHRAAPPRKRPPRNRLSTKNPR